MQIGVCFGVFFQGAIFDLLEVRLLFQRSFKTARLTVMVHSLKLTAKAPARFRYPKRKRSSTPAIHFQVLLLMAEIWRSPPGMVLKPYKSWDKLPTSTGAFPPDFRDPSTVC